MTILCNDQERLEPPRRCKDLAAALRDAFTYCSKCNGRKVTLSVREDEDDNSNTIYDFGYEHEVVVWEIRNRAMEKLRHKPKTVVGSFTWRPSCPKHNNESNVSEEEGDQRSEFCSVGSNFSDCSSGLSKEAYVSAKTELSCCSSLNGLMEFENPWKVYLKEFKKRSMIQEFCHCEGWPFGLAKRAVMLPPLPKSPAESWSWRKRNRVSAYPYI